MGTHAVDEHLPTFLIVGAAKAGTTSLYHYVRQHPDVYMSPVKEPRYFALAGHPLDFRGPGDDGLRTTTTTTLAGYRALFADRRGERAAGEASVVYLPHPDAAAAIARAIPHVKIVAVLRNPVERAYSSFLYHVRMGREPLESFEEALAAEEERREAGWFTSWQYRGQGFYHRHLSRYYTCFPPEQIRVFLHEELDRDPNGLLCDLFGFLDVDDEFRSDVGIRWNRSGYPRNHRFQRVLTARNPLKEAVTRRIPARMRERVQNLNLQRPPISEDTRAELVAGYDDDIRRLEQLIGRDLSAWLAPPVTTRP